ncbi:hypothetical protein GDO81_003469 [Engystomops pustulosus]|uniref:Uncharacterized protein n=1 Tax=Engystomops pustulosus TaxID=76066 RepID=A0AAV7A1E2_ENGPU|nr:hypothetical protein GDO81_003469 [Engystomops pustulosus]
MDFYFFPCLCFGTFLGFSSGQISWWFFLIDTCGIWLFETSQNASNSPNLQSFLTLCICLVRCSLNFAGENLTFFAIF